MSPWSAHATWHPRYRQGRIIELSGLPVKIIETVVLLQRGEFAESAEGKQSAIRIHEAIKQAEWPVGSGSFTIHPESGKKSGEGNGVVPIKLKPMQVLRQTAGRSNTLGRSYEGHTQPGRRARHQARRY